jgi:hypothetical protein
VLNGEKNPEFGLTITLDNDKRFQVFVGTAP